MDQSPPSSSFSSSSWADLPAELVALIIGKMDKSSLINYARTSRHSLCDLFFLSSKTRYRCTAAEVKTSVPLRLLHDALRTRTYPRSQDYYNGSGREYSKLVIYDWEDRTDWEREIILNAVAALPILLSQGRRNTNNYNSFWACLTSPKLRPHIWGLYNVWHVPRRLTNLRYFRMHGEWFLEDDWFPESSAGNVEELDAAYSALERLPPNMVRLKKVDVSGCKDLDEHWLPESSAGNIEVLE